MPIKAFPYPLIFKVLDTLNENQGKEGMIDYLSVKISKDGSDFTSITNDITELGSGWYKAILTSNETDCNVMNIDIQCSYAGTFVQPIRLHFSTEGASKYTLDFGINYDIKNKVLKAKCHLIKDGQVADEISNLIVRIYKDTENPIYEISMSKINTTSVWQGSINEPNLDNYSIYYAVIVATLNNGYEIKAIQYFSSVEIEE